MRRSRRATSSCRPADRASSAASRLCRAATRCAAAESTDRFGVAAGVDDAGTRCMSETAPGREAAIALCMAGDAAPSAATCTKTAAPAAATVAVSLAEGSRRSPPAAGEMCGADIGVGIGPAAASTPSAALTAASVALDGGPAMPASGVSTAEGTATAGNDEADLRTRSVIDVAA